MYQMLLICQIYLFRYCEEFNCDLSNWDVSNVNNMEDIFYNCNMKIIPNWYYNWYQYKKIYHV